MSDGISVSPGAGAKIATDEINGDHYQRFKLTFGVDGVATDVSAISPLPVTDAAYTGVVAFVPGADQVARRAILLACSAAGNVSLKLSDDSVLIVPVEEGISVFPLAVKAVNLAGTTATANYFNLK